MENLIVSTVSLLIKFFVFGQLYLLWVSRIRPAIQKHYSLAKNAAPAPDTNPDMWKSVYSDLSAYYLTSKSLLAALSGYIYASIRDSTFLHRNFPAIMRHMLIKHKKEI